MAAVETTDVVVIGTGFGGAIPAYYLSAGGARVVMLERGPRLATADFTQDLRLDTYTRIVDLINGTGMSVVAGNCVGGGSVVYFAASLRAPSFVFERQGTLGRHLWPTSITRGSLDGYYDRVESVLPVAHRGERGAGGPPRRREVERERVLEAGVVAGEGIVRRAHRARCWRVPLLA